VGIVSKREEILTAAIDLFAREGYTAVSIRDITAAAGIKESSLYNHFSSKEQLLTFILESLRREFQAVFPSPESMATLLPRTEPGQFLRNGFERCKAHMNSPRVSQLWRIISMEQYRNPLAREILLKDMVEHTLQFLEAAFAHYVAAGQIRPLAPSILAAEYQYPVFAMLTEYNLLVAAGADTGVLERRMEEHIDFFLAAIKS
jgi:AcrR family transcriptional regulator